MIDRVKNEILQTADMLLMRTGDDPKENLRTAYNAALAFDDMPPETKEAPDDMFNRTGKYVFAVSDALDDIAQEVYQRAGLIGGAAGSASLADIDHLSDEDAKTLFDVTFAQRDILIFKKDLVATMIAWAAKKKDEESGKE